jgi:hypothetical protein
MNLLGGLYCWQFTTYSRITGLSPGISEEHT